jgi:hypothetical protein
VHTGQALANDVDLDELREILDEGDAANADPAELVAILFAQHFADGRGWPSAHRDPRVPDKCAGAPADLDAIATEHGTHVGCDGRQRVLSLT